MLPIVACYVVDAVYREPLDSNFMVHFFSICCEALRLAVPVVAFIALIWSLVKRRISGGISYTAIIGAYFLTYLLSPYLGWSLDSIYLRTHETYFARRIRDARSQATYPGFVRFDWGGGWDSPNELIFDESDTIQSTQLGPNSPLSTDDIFTQCKFSAERLQGHFYSAQFAC
jgi:hypothetical protein